MTINVGEACGRIHAAVERLPVCTRPLQVPFDNGLYFFFETGEESRHGPKERIVRVGKNTSRSLKQRLDQHFGTQKNSSVFRKYVGGALIRQRTGSAISVRLVLRQDQVRATGSVRTSTSVQCANPLRVR